jgi:two-component system NarL family response regulator
MSEPRIRILLVEDHAIARFGVEAIIADEQDLELVGIARDGAEAIALHEQHRPTLVLMDLHLPGIDGVEATRAIRKEEGAARVLVLSSYEADDEIRRALAAGAAGYVMKEAEPDELLRAIRAVAGGATYVSARIQARLSETESEAPLSPREREILQLMARGLSNPEIASVLSISKGTVRIHSSGIFAKLGAGNRAEAVARGLERGIIAH